MPINGGKSNWKKKTAIGTIGIGSAAATLAAYKLKNKTNKEKEVNKNYDSDDEGEEETKVEDERIFKGAKDKSNPEVDKREELCYFEDFNSAGCVEFKFSTSDAVREICSPERKNSLDTVFDPQVNIYLLKVTTKDNCPSQLIKV